MIVVVIIGILAAIAIPIFANQQKAAIQASVKSDVKNTQSNVVAFIAKNPNASSLFNHTDSPVANRPLLVQTRDNIVSITGTWDSYTIISKNSDRTYQCTFDSNVGKISCSDTI